VTTFGIFVQLDQLFVEGLVHVTDLGSDYFQYDDARHELRGERTGKKFQLTDRVSVQVVRVDLESRKIDLRLAGADAPPPKADKSDSQSKDRKSNIKPGPSVPKAQPTKAAPAKAAAPQPAAKPASKGRGGRKTNAAASAAVAPRAAQPASKSKKKR